MTFKTNPIANQLSPKDFRIYKIFNIMLLITMVITTSFAVFLMSLGSYSSVAICIGEVFVFALMYQFHLKGHFNLTRYLFFLFAILMQMYGSLFHGENGGFDFLFLVTCLTPILFFEKKKHYWSLFFISLCAFVSVKLLYNVVEPEMPLETRTAVPYYMNIAISVTFTYLGFILFKNEHLKYEEELQVQKQRIKEQNAALNNVKEQLENLLQVRSAQIQEQNEDFVKYAFLNSHKVRSPLARIMGLINLSKYEDFDEEEKRQYYFDEMKLNAEELDEILKEINVLLDNNTNN